MVKYILLKQYIPGRTYDEFRPNGYDKIEVVELDEPQELPKDFLSNALMNARNAERKRGR